MKVLEATDDLGGAHVVHNNSKGNQMLLWILFATLYLVAVFTLGLATLRKGHTVLFWVGIVFPLLWIVGALMAPTAKAVAAEPSLGQY